MKTAESSQCSENSKTMEDACEFKPIQSISFKWDGFKYESNMSIIPFPGNGPERGRFNNSEEAVAYIFKHCMKYHGNTKKATVFRYFPLAEILDLASGGYLPLTSNSTKTLNSLYMKQCRKASSHK